MSSIFSGRSHCFFSTSTLGLLFRALLRAGCGGILLVGLAHHGRAAADPAPFSLRTTTHEAVDITLTAAREHDWWESPVRAVFRHQISGREITLSAFWDGDRSWIVRFAPTLAGEWTLATNSRDPGLHGVRGTVQALVPTREQLARNPNYHGQLAISRNGRHFTYADGTPFLLLADTAWAINTARCGLGEHQDGPFYQYLADRRAKGFTALLLKHIRGTGDTTDLTGHRNEGGYAFDPVEEKKVNPAFFRGLDTRVRAIWERGFVHAMPVAWFGKRKCWFTLEEAKRLSAYFMIRYGPFNGLFALGGEYQYAFRDCHWSPDAYNELGRVVQAQNVFHQPVSIHPSSNTLHPAPHNTQSSNPYHHSGWLDHNWLQTGQQLSQLPNVVRRSLENYALEPARPVFLAEAHYERVSNPEHVYHARWQAWSAFLNGAAGYGHGAWGLWQFRDPYDPKGETDNDFSSSVVWWEALAFEGATHVGYVRRLLENYPWWELAPRRDAIKVDGIPAALPTEKDLSPPSCASVRDELFVAYLPRGNAGRRLTIGPLGDRLYRAIWFNPRSGVSLGTTAKPATVGEWEIPARLEPADEDWVLVLQAVRQ